MTYGPAETMRVPWETVAKMYTQRLSGPLLGSSPLMPRSVLASSKGWTGCSRRQPKSISSSILPTMPGSVFNRDELDKSVSERAKPSRKERLAALATLIARDHEDWGRYLQLACAQAGYGERPCTIFADTLETSSAISSRACRCHRTCRQLYGKPWPVSTKRSGFAQPINAPS